MRARKYQKNGQTFLNFEKFNIKIIPGQTNIKLTNLFQGNPGLEEIGNAFINGNSDFFLTDVYPGIENSLSEMFTNIANKITGEASFDELFPNY
jgi:Haemolymph juvenile hormone binding protein (JHBP)